MPILAGTSGFAFKEWKGVFYPEGTKDAGMLSYYASRFPTVEINNTFYRLPKESVIAGWAQQVPEAFSFSVKASQRITHFQRLKPESEETVKYLVKATDAMGSKRGPILFQLPPNMKKDMDRLRPFLDVLPKGPRYAMEFRHASWFEPEVVAVLRDHDVAWVAIDQEEFRSPLESTASWGYVRLHRFDYDAAAIDAWAKRIQALGWTDAYVYFKHDHVPDGLSGPLAVDAFVKACAC